MNLKFIKYYLYILPIYSLIGIILSIFRTVYSESFTLVFLFVGFIFNFLIVIVGKKYLVNKLMGPLIIFLLISLSVGFFNGNELSRRYITDFMLPFFFFSKILIFTQFWKYYNFEKFLRYYVKTAFWGSIILLPLTYYLFQSAGSTRLAIFPPMELPFSLYMQSGGLLLLISLFVILLYGKRAQLVGALGVLLVYFFYFKRKKTVKSILVLFIIIFLGVSLINIYEDNLAIRRLSYTISQFKESDNSLKGLKKISSGREEEIFLVMDKLSFWSTLFGFGLGIELEVSGRDKTIGNIHFSPLSFIMKYGVFFTIFLYTFIFKHLVGRKNILKGLNSSYIAALGTILFVFIESIFAYTLFVNSIFPIAFGYVRLKHLKQI